MNDDEMVAAVKTYEEAAYGVLRTLELWRSLPTDASDDLRTEVAKVVLRTHRQYTEADSVMTHLGAKLAVSEDEASHG